jgi:hypothetical protein
MLDERLLIADLVRRQRRVAGCRTRGCRMGPLAMDEAGRSGVATQSLGGHIDTGHPRASYAGR